MDKEFNDNRLKYRKKSFFAQRAYSFKNALKGVFVFLREETHSNIIIALTILVPLAGWYFQLNEGEWVAVIVAIALVVITEMLNSAIERIIDLLHPDWHKEAGNIKDIAAGATLVASTAALIIGLIVFGNKITGLF